MPDEPRERILIVDDEPALLETYESLLESRFVVETAATGSEGLAALTEDVAVVVLDRRLPGRSGEEILAEIRARPADYQVIFCSAIVPDIDVIPLPVDDYLLKPVGSERLIEALERQCRLATTGDAVREYARLRAKRRAIESANPPVALRENVQYQRLCDRVERQAAAVAESPEELPTLV